MLLLLLLWGKVEEVLLQGGFELWEAGEKPKVCRIGVGGVTGPGLLDGPGPDWGGEHRVDKERLLLLDMDIMTLSAIVLQDSGACVVALVESLEVAGNPELRAPPPPPFFVNGSAGKDTRCAMGATTQCAVGFPIQSEGLKN
eukprot:scaffold66838_cov33-Tisochrysis_lutea.AAC.1